MSGVTRKNRIRNEYMSGSIGVASIVDKIRVNRLRWFRHVMRREETKSIRTIMKMNVKGKRGRSRPKKRWLYTIDNDLRAIGVCVENVEN
jgi:hypothetical protein